MVSALVRLSDGEWAQVRVAGRTEFDDRSGLGGRSRFKSAEGSRMGSKFKSAERS